MFCGGMVDACVGELYPVCGHVWLFMLGMLLQVCVASGVAVVAIMYAIAGTLCPVSGHVCLGCGHTCV